MTVPDWLLERYALGEVSAAERAQVESDPDLEQQLAQLRSSDAEIRQVYSAKTVAQRALARAEAPSRPAWQLLAGPVALAASALLAVLWAGDLPGDGHRGKGIEPALTVYRQTEGEPEVLAPGATAHPGDRLQLMVASEGGPGWVLSFDGAGVVTLHNDGRLEPGIHPMELAFVLDDAPDFEHFYLVLSTEPIGRAALLREAEAFVARHPGPGERFDLPDAEEVDVRVNKP